MQLDALGTIVRFACSGFAIHESSALLVTADEHLEGVHGTFRTGDWVTSEDFASEMLVEGVEVCTPIHLDGTVIVFVVGFTPFFQPIDDPFALNWKPPVTEALSPCSLQLVFRDFAGIGYEQSLAVAVSMFASHSIDDECL